MIKTDSISTTQLDVRNGSNLAHINFVGGYIQSDCSYFTISTNSSQHLTIQTDLLSIKKAPQSFTNDPPTLTCDTNLRDAAGTWIISSGKFVAGSTSLLPVPKNSGNTLLNTRDEGDCYTTTIGNNSRSDGSRFSLAIGVAAAAGSNDRSILVGICSSSAEAYHTIATTIDGQTSKCRQSVIIGGGLVINCMCTSIVIGSCTSMDCIQQTLIIGHYTSNSGGAGLCSSGASDPNYAVSIGHYNTVKRASIAIGSKIPIPQEGTTLIHPDCTSNHIGFNHDTAAIVWACGSYGDLRPLNSISLWELKSLADKATDLLNLLNK